MGNVINYNSWDEVFKAPFGALKVNERTRINIKVNESHDVYNISMIISKEEIEVSRINLIKVDDKNFECELNPFENVGLYFYYFEVDLNLYGSSQKLFYGKSLNSGEACEYFHDNINKYQITVHEDFKVPTWYKEGILYHIFVDRFNNGNRNDKPSNPKKNSFIYANWEDDPMYIKDEEGDIIRWDFYGGNLKGIINKLGYLKKLGVSIIYLSPIFEASSNHKYDTGDYKKIDSMFGNEEIFEELIEKAKARGISIILDGVFSHTGADSKYFNKYGNYDSVGAYQSEKSCFSTWYNFTDYPEEYKCWWGIKALPNVNELDHSYMNYIIYDKDSVMKKWTSMGIKGWRLDVADELPTEFIKEFKRELKEIDKEAILAGEVWEDASNKISYGERREYLLGHELDSVMGYPFRKNIISFLKGEINSEQLNNEYMETKENYPKESFKSNLNLLGTHDVNRIKTELNSDKNMVKLAILAQMTFEGVPYIYYGDEAGLEGKTDPDNRKTYPWKNPDEDMIEFYKHAINIRKKNAILVQGDTKFVYTKNEDVFGYIRFIKDIEEDDMLILINRSNEIKSIKINIDVNSIEEVDIKYSPRKYGLNIDKEEDIFNLDINPKSFRIFNLKK